jgi:GTP-binding protein
VAGDRGGIPVVAIVGRPNVGKSTLFNRFLGQRSAIVEDRARTTRDRLYGDTEWNGRRFVIVDTGGLEMDPGDPIEARVQEQAQLADAEADVILFVVDATTGTTPADLEAAVRLPGVLFSLLGCATTGFLAWRLYDKEIAWCALTTFAAP